MKRLQQIFSLLVLLFCAPIFAADHVSDADVDLEAQVVSPSPFKKWDTRVSHDAIGVGNFKFLIEQSLFAGGTGAIALLARSKRKIYVVESSFYFNRHDIYDVDRYESWYFKKSVCTHFSRAAMVGTAFLVLDTATGMAISCYGYQPQYFGNLKALGIYLTSPASASPSPHDQRLSPELEQDLRKLDATLRHR